MLPVVPMFHANAWGLARGGGLRRRPGHAGPDLSPKGLASLIESERVTLAAGVPTIWMGVLPELEGRTPRRSGPSRAAGRPCPGRCPRPTASKTACRSCRRGA